MKYVMIALFVFAISFGARPETASAFACNYYENTKLQTIAPGKREMLCNDVLNELRAHQDQIDELQEAIVGMQLEAIAKVLRETEGEVPNLTRIQIDQQPTAFAPYCCSCVPDETCSGYFGELCNYQSDGMCQSGEFRVICSGITTDTCVTID